MEYHEITPRVDPDDHRLCFCCNKDAGFGRPSHEPAHLGPILKCKSCKQRKERGLMEDELQDLRKRYLDTIEAWRKENDRLRDEIGRLKNTLSLTQKHSNVEHSTGALIIQLQQHKEEDIRLKSYPNLQAIISGTISGYFNNWPAVKVELDRLLVNHVSDITNLREKEAENFNECYKTALSLALEIDKCRKLLLDFGQGRV